MATTDSAIKTSPQASAALFPDPATAWHKSAPKAVRKASRSDGWACWVKHLAKRKYPAEPWSGQPDGEMPLLWAMPEGIGRVQVPDRFVWSGCLGRRHRADPALGTLVSAWLEASAAGGTDAGFALETLGWCHALPRLAARLAPEAWWGLLGRLVAIAAEAAQIPLADNPLVHQLLAGELAATLAYLLPETKPCRRLARPARRALSAGLIELTDGRGFLHTRYLPDFRPLLACWTRCRQLGDLSGTNPWRPAAEKQYRRLIRTALRLARPDGSQVFSNGDGQPGGIGMLRTALRLGGKREERQIAPMVLAGPGKQGRRAKRPVGSLGLPDPAIHSEWAAAAVLRRDWSRSSERLTVAYPGREVHTEMSAGRTVFWSGRWDLEVHRDGQPVGPISDWQEVCWLSDDDVDYLELQVELTEDLKVQRHMLLAREDRFLLLADSVMGRGPARIDYCGRLPLRPDVRFQPAAETREGFLERAAGRKRRALLMPLALPEWRADPLRGDLVQTEAGLELRQATEQGSLMAPLFFDLAPKRMTRPRTWRQLTVAESLRAVPRDVAVGYRAAVGKAQWLIYRSLGPRGNRSVLGQNFSSEMVVARFRRRGEHEPLIELE
jgi:hypothetical protein